jgi:hypothetical protein
MSLDDIHARNARVEADKAWETSWTRRLSIALATYITIMFYLTLLGMDRVYLHALVPVVGYLLSTVTLPVLKKYWMKKIYNKKKILSRDSI